MTWEVSVSYMLRLKSWVFMFGPKQYAIASFFSSEYLNFSFAVQLEEVNSLSNGHSCSISSRLPQQCDILESPTRLNERRLFHRFHNSLISILLMCPIVQCLYSFPFNDEVDLLFEAQCHRLESEKWVRLDLVPRSTCQQLDEFNDSYSLLPLVS